MARHRAKHRAPSRTGRTLARTAIGAAVAGVPFLALAPTADAAADSTWDRVAQCESGGNWAIDTGNGYSGGLQFAPRTWLGFDGGQFAPTAHQATREQQIVVAERVLAVQGWGAWPSCSRKAGATGEAATPRTAPTLPAVPQIRLSTPAGTYVVRAGDTLSKIAAAHGIGNWRDLLAKNPVLAGNPNLIRVGQVVIL